MATILTGVVMLVVGVGNLAIGRSFPERINARFQRGLGYVGIACGTITAGFGIIFLIYPPK